MSPSRSTYQIIFLVVFLIPVVLFAQDKKPRKGVKNPKISQETRINSAKYADGIREFYSNNYTAAEEIFRSIVLEDSKNDAALYMLSKISEQRKDYTGAIAYLTQALKINQKNVWYRVALATMYDQIGDYKNSEKVWKEVCETVTNNEYYLYSLANALLKNEKYEEVIKTFNKMEDIIGINEEITETKKDIWLYVNKVDKAVGEYQRLIDLYPYEVKNYVIIGDIYRTNNHLNNALTYYKKAELIDSMHPNLLISFIDYYKETKNKVEEKKYVMRLFHVENQSDLIFPIFKKEIQTLTRNKEKEKLSEAILLGEAFVQSNPTLGEGYGILSHLYYFSLNFPKALKMSELAISFNDHSYETWSVYLSSLDQLEEYLKIQEKAEEVQLLFPTQSYLYFLIGQSYYKTKDNLKAIPLLQASLEHSIENRFSAEVSELLGDIYKMEGQQSEALKHYKLSQRYGNKSEDLQEKIDQIK